MKILVTGAAGFIGSHTSEGLLERGHEVVGFDSFDSYLYDAERKRRNVAELDPDLASGYRLIEGDLADRDALADAVTGVDVVCHLAALAGVRPSLAEPTRYMRTNVEGTTNVYEACLAADVDRVVFASSSSVYGSRAEDGAFRETDECIRCASPYGASKRMTELLSATYTDLYGLGLFGLRFFTVYGPRQRPDMAIHKFVRAAVDGTSVPFYGDGSSSRDYTYVDDIVTGTIGAVEAVEAGRYELYNLGGTATTSLAQLVAIVEEVTGLEVPVERLPAQPGDVPRTHADISRAERDLGYGPTTDVPTGIAHFWDWFKRVEHA